MPLLNTATKLYVGGLPVKAVYARDVQVWPSGFDPTTIPGLTLWLDASQLGLADGAYVDTWPSLVGAHVGVNIAGPPNRPVMRTNALNSLPVVRFAPGNGLRWPTTGINIEWTVVYVGRMRPGHNARLVTAQYLPNNLLVGFWNAMQDVMYDNGFTSPDTQRAATNDWMLYSGDGSDTPSRHSRLLSNGVLLGTTGTSAGWGGTFNLNGYGAMSTEETSDAEAAEVLMFNRKLADAERQEVEGYLRSKWLPT